MGGFEDAREAASQTVGARPGSLTDVHGVALLTAIDAGTARATVSFRGSQPFKLPFMGAAADYAAADTVLVLCNPLEGGRAVFVLGPIGQVDDAVSDSVPDAPASTATATATIVPTWSGTWRVDRAAWDRWNIDRYGGRSDLYQGDDYGSGTLIGLATYGDQIVNLAATSIASAVLTVQRNGSGGSAAVTVQGAPHASRPAGAPSPSGTTASSAVLSATGKGSISLDSAQREALRTGSAKSLALVGATYAGVFGTSRADGMALVITYAKPI